MATPRQEGHLALVVGGGELVAVMFVLLVLGWRWRRTVHDIADYTYDHDMDVNL